MTSTPVEASQTRQCRLEAAEKKITLLCLLMDSQLSQLKPKLFPHKSCREQLTNPIHLSAKLCSRNNNKNEYLHHIRDYTTYQNLNISSRAFTHLSV